MKAEQKFVRYKIQYSFEAEDANRDINRQIANGWFVVTMLRMDDRNELWVIYEKHYDEPKYANNPRIQ